MDNFIFQLVKARDRVVKNPDLINIIVEDLPTSMTIQQAKDMWLFCGFKRMEIVQAHKSEETKRAMLEEGFHRYTSLSNPKKYISGKSFFRLLTYILMYSNAFLIRRSHIPLS